MMMNNQITHMHIDYDSNTHKLIYGSFDEFLFGILNYWQYNGIYSLYLYYCKNEVVVYPQHAEVDINIYTLATSEKIPYHLNNFQLGQWIKNVINKLPIL